MADETPSASSSTPKTASTRARGAKPRAGIQRKTKEEREQYAKQEAERQAARTAEAARGAGGRGGTRARGGRAGLRGRGGRDGAATQDSRGRDVPPGSGGGVFGATVRQQDTRPKIISGGVGEMLVSGQAGDGTGQSRTADGVSGASGTASGSGSRGGAVKPLTGESIEIGSDDEPEESKLDIDRICLSGDENEDPVLDDRSKRKSPLTHRKVAAGLRPVRAPRAPREEEKQIAAKNRRESRALKKTDSEPQGVEDEDVMDIDDPTTTTSLGKERTSSPETRRRSLRKGSGRGREVKFASETIEERAERLRLADDVFKLRQTFSDDPQTQYRCSRGQSSSSNKIKQDDEDETMDLEADMDYSSQNLLLFQLPALTPYLHDSRHEPPSQPQVKEEPRDDQTHPPPSTASAAKDSDPKTGTGTGPDRPLPPDGLLTATEPARLPSGLVGKLRLHKSGKVSLDWGGTDMEVRYGTEVDFLQDVVLIEPPVSSAGKTKKEDSGNAGFSTIVKNEGGSGDGNGQQAEGTDAANTDEQGDEDEDVGDPTIGKTYSLGQVRRKLVLIPDWAKLYD
ncbi:hypothetical protein PV10_04587 [Exophiala mesophila]|uniref:DNA-directed RNA polymerase III subunit RPC4 n=1 Tax=Exophiala mesophila TaxID=212818 RepID=A0A0D1XYQ2_EXOME|nr:uncharacterized protein PV10_04587 [Exophiala mesophila]KIV93371.1 hypothetical protein PV10_04587 [Exophiala mesophila]